MRRVLLLTIAVFVIILPVVADTSTTQQPQQGTLPKPGDYPVGDRRCKLKHRLIAKVTSRAVEFQRGTVECELLVHRTCDDELKKYSSGARPTKANVCADYYAAARALNGREICCDDHPSEDQPASSDPNCESPTPWFDTSSGCSDPQTPQVSINGATATLSMCGQVVFSTTNDEYKDPVFQNAFRQAVRDQLQYGGASRICCDKFRDGMRTGKPCDPTVDVDCDGKPNKTDYDNNKILPEIGSFLRRSGGNIDNFPPGFNSSDPKFLPDPVGRASKGVGGCPCKWEMVKGELHCSPDGKKNHYYIATWKCPTTGAEVFTTKYAPATSPCTK